MGDRDRENNNVSIPITSIRAGQSETILNLPRPLKSVKVQLQIRFTTPNPAPALGSIDVLVIRNADFTGQNVIDNDRTDTTELLTAADVAAKLGVSSVTYGTLNIDGLEGVEIRNGLDVNIAKVFVEIKPVEEIVKLDKDFRKEGKC